MANTWGNNGNSDRLYLLGLQNHCRWWLHPWNSKTLAPWKKSYHKPIQHIKKQRHHFSKKVPIVRAMVSPVVMYGCEGWAMNTEELMLSNCDAGEDSWGTRGLQWDQTSQEPTRLKRPWCRERLKEGGEGDSRGWNGWTHHQFNRPEFEQTLEKWRTGKPGMLQSMGVSEYWTQLSNWTKTFQIFVWLFIFIF